MQILGTIQNEPVNGSTEVAASNPTPQENRQVTPPPGKPIQPHPPTLSPLNH